MIWNGKTREGKEVKVVLLAQHITIGKTSCLNVCMFIMHELGSSHAHIYIYVDQKRFCDVKNLTLSL